GGRGGPPPRRGLPPGARVRAAADRRGRGRHRPAGDALRRQGLDPGGDPLPPAPAGEPRRRRAVMPLPGGRFPFELFVGLRYLRSKGGRGALSLLTVIAMAGMALGVMALIVVIGVMSGAEAELRGKILGTTAHILVLDTAGQCIPDPAGVVKVIRQQPEVRSAAPFVLQQVMLAHEQAATGVVLRGIDPEVGQAELAR